MRSEASAVLPAAAPSGPRRVLCLIVPDLLCELVLPRFTAQHKERTAEQARASNRARVEKRSNQPSRMIQPALAVVLTEEPRALTALDTLDAVNETARRCGIAIGQSIAEAQAQMGRLQVRSLSVGEVQHALGQIAESVLQFGVTAALHAPDTLCLDISGVAHLFGGEEALALQVATRVRSMGHTVRVAVANGPLVAQALGRWANYGPKDNGVRCFKASQIPIELERLPIAALPVAEVSTSSRSRRDAHTKEAGGDELIAWFMRCGLYSVGDLKRLPRASFVARLGGNRAATVLDFIQGQDATVLVPHVPAPQLCEVFEAEEGLSGVEPLLFVLKGLSARLSARLQGRGQAVRELKLNLSLDRSIAELCGAAASVSCGIELPAPIFRAEEIERIVATRCKRLQLPAPVVVVQLEADGLAEADALQLDLSRVLQGAGGSRNQGTETLPILLAEIAADIGSQRVGVLQEVASHRPEAKSVLTEPVFSRSKTKTPNSKQRSRRTPKQGAVGVQRTFAELSRENDRAPATNLSSTPNGAEPIWSALDDRLQKHLLHPTRLLPKALPLSVKLEPGATVVVGRTLFTIQKAQFESRLNQIEWWSGTAVSRDYWSLWLASPTGGCAALAFVEQSTGHRYLQAIYD